MTQLGMYLIRKGDMPYLDVDEDLNGFYKDENAKYRHFDATSSRTHRLDSNANAFDRWYMGESDMPQGWFPHTQGFSMDSLKTKYEKIAIAKLVKDGVQIPLCRFNAHIENQDKTLYGFVESISPNNYQCSMGEDITYRLSDGTHIQPRSEVNQFDWLSLYKPDIAEQMVLTDEGFPLCTINDAGFYGVGYREDGIGCQLDSNVYWSNGKHWYFSGDFNIFTYR